MISDELKAQTSGGDGRKRNEGTRKSLRSSANRFAASIRKKVSTLENSVGFRRAFSPLSDDSPNTTIVGESSRTFARAPIEELLENSVGFRRAFSPLSDDSPNTTIVGESSRTFARAPIEELLENSVGFRRAFSPLSDDSPNTTIVGESSRTFARAPIEELLENSVGFRRAFSPLSDDSPNTTIVGESSRTFARAPIEELLENSVGFRRAFSPLSDDSPNTTIVGESSRTFARAPIEELLENSVGFRRAFSPLSDDSPNTTIVGPDEISYIDGRRYEFRDGGLMKTPDASPSPWGAHSNPVRFKTQLSYGLQLKASNGKKEHNLRERLAKQLARCRIWQHGSPMVGRRACRGSKRKLQLGNGRLLDENQKENESPKLLAIGRVSSSKVNRRHLF
ncbi:hypothetical protein Tcan_18777 [Toxocara canis]|uniref:Uncharacterized protein n=1 Tax=Toxocara canis TaxID=6265 RepID=A0A0B2VJA5_TOXCA|nr:hypothetical protein Tcan_18777 [Toxocara canis]